MTLLTRRLVDPATDIDLLYRWVSEDRAVFWGMTDHTRDEVAEIYGYIDEQEHLAAYLIVHEDVPAALYQTYDPFVDEIGDYYDRLPGDRGMHFFMAPDKKPLSTEVIGFCVAQELSDPAVSRLVAEPDARNVRAVRLVCKAGFSLGPQVDLPHKPAQFAFLTREAYDGLTPAV